MRRSIDVLLLAAVVGYAGFWFYSNPSAAGGLLRLAENAVKPCSKAITYSIGEIDPRFKLAESALKADLKTAEGIWEKASGTDLFEYRDTGGTVTVSLVYDERQAATDKLKSVGISIDKSKSSYDSLKAQYDTMHGQLEGDQAAYERAVEAYKAHEIAYNAEVQKWNRQGGAPQGEFEKLQAGKAQLEEEFAALRALGEKANSRVETVNALATTMNQLIVQLNLNVRQYNQEGATAGEFEEGKYQLLNGEETITIYEYENRIQLARVLAHELGHSLGLDHVEGEDSIMYKVNTKENLSASEEDAAALEKACTPRFSLGS